MGSGKSTTHICVSVCFKSLEVRLCGLRFDCCLLIIPGYILQWLAAKGLLPLERFVIVDPDAIRTWLPEWHGLVAQNASTAGYRTQREVGSLAEILTTWALDNGRSVVIDSSLRDAAWHAEYFTALRRLYPRVRLAILHVTASYPTLRARVTRRAVKEGRMVPDAVLQDAWDRIPAAVTALTPYCFSLATL